MLDRFVLLVLTAGAAIAQTPETLFQTQCAACHNAGNSVGAPLPETLHKMPWQAILTALESGKMAGIGSAMSAPQRESIAKLLGTVDTQAVSATAHCAGTPARRGGAAWYGWADAANTRFQPAKAAGLNRETTPKLMLKWSFGFPGATTAFGTPTVVAGKVFVGAADGSVYSLDARTGCVY